MDTACDLLPIYPRVFGFTQGGLAALPFHADTHVRAIMMHMVWDEMRARENLKDKDKRTLGPLGVAELNDQLWAVGTLLRSENDEEVLSILDPAFKPFAPDPADWYKIRNARTVPTVDGTGVLPYHDGRGDSVVWA